MKYNFMNAVLLSTGVLIIILYFFCALHQRQWNRQKWEPNHGEKIRMPCAPAYDSVKIYKQGYRQAIKDIKHGMYSIDADRNSPRVLHPRENTIK